MPIYVQLIFTGIIMLVSAGPLDFAWHSAFGLDGLLSPPHAVLATGMVLSSVGAFLGMISINTKYNEKFPIYIIIGIVPVWITVSGIIYMVSLPFSDTEYFKFNPNPVLAALIATLAFPFLVSFILFTSFRITKRFGVLSIVGIIFIIINLVTTILPNKNLVPTIPFYFLNVIPIIAIDALLSLTTIGMSPPLLLSQTRREIISMLSGIILGLTFFMLYFPLITHTYNEVIANPQPLWPSVTASVYFEMIDETYPLLVISSMATGMLGVVISSKLIGRASLQH